MCFVLGQNVKFVIITEAIHTHIEIAFQLSKKKKKKLTKKIGYVYIMSVYTYCSSSQMILKRIQHTKKKIIEKIYTKRVTSRKKNYSRILPVNTKIECV